MIKINGQNVIANNRYRCLFEVADQDQDQAVTEEELNKTKYMRETFGSDLADFERTYYLQRLNIIKKFDNDPNMHFWEFMKAINILKRETIFSEDEIKTSFRYEFNMKEIMKDPKAIKRLDNDLKKSRDFLKKIFDKKPWIFEYYDGLLVTDKDFVLELVKKKHYLYRYIDRSLRSDKDIASAAIRGYSGNIEYADPSLQNDEDFILDMVGKTHFLVKYLGIRFRSDRVFIEKAVRRNSDALDGAIESIKKDKGFVSKMVDISYGVFYHVHNDLKNDKPYVLSLLPDHPDIFQYLGFPLNKDIDVVMAAVSHDGGQLSRVDPSMKCVKQVVMAAVSNAGQAIYDADVSMKTDKDVVFAAVEGNWSIIFPDIHNVTLPDQLIFQKVLKEKLPEYNRKIEAAVRKLKALGIERMTYIKNMKEAETIIKNREEISKQTDKRVAVIISAKHDETGALGLNNGVTSLLANGYRVFYFEVKTDTDIYQAIKSAGKDNKVDALIINGHGWGQNTYLHNNALDRDRYTEEQREKYMLDVSDLKEMLSLKLSQYMCPKSTIILNSCSTGIGGENANNLANMLKEVFPFSNILSPMADSSTSGYLYNKDKLIGVKFSFYDEETGKKIKEDKIYPIIRWDPNSK